jgi:hypothetical protein
MINAYSGSTWPYTTTSAGEKNLLVISSEQAPPNAEMSQRASLQHHSTLCDRPWEIGFMGSALSRTSCSATWGVRGKPSSKRQFRILKSSLGTTNHGIQFALNAVVIALEVDHLSVMSEMDQ